MPRSCSDGGGEARRVALLTDHDDLQVVVGNRQPRVAAGIEAPLQDVALDDKAPGTTPSASRCAAGLMSTTTAPARQRLLGLRGVSRAMRLRADSSTSSMVLGRLRRLVPRQQ